MKYLRLFESFEDIDEICINNFIYDYSINTNGSVDANQTVILRKIPFGKLPLKFNKVNGNFFCSSNNLTSLEGSPIEINGVFDCSNNNLTSFEYAPRIIRGGFDCSYNNIKTFEYFPSFVYSTFLCLDNPIEGVWNLFEDTNNIELLNDFDIFRDEDTDEPAIVMDRLNDFLLTIGNTIVKKVKGYKRI